METKKSLKEENLRLKNLMYEYEEYCHVLTGHTYSYNALRELTLELIDNMPEEKIELYSQRLKYIDAIAHHTSIGKDHWITSFYS